MRMAKLRKFKFEVAIENTRKQETLVKDLVGNFLVPGIERRRLERIVELEQMRYRESVKKLIGDGLKGVGKKVGERLRGNINKGKN